MHAKDWRWLAPNLVSLLRLPLALGFPWLTHRPYLALGLLVVAALTDVLDGMLARRLGQATALGALVDGVLDKLFAGIVVGSLLLQQRVSLTEAALLGARELGELPLVLWWSFDRAQRKARAATRRANWLGKLATVVQFFAIGSVLTDSSLRTLLLAITAVCGIASAIVYWRRELSTAQQHAADGR